MKKEYKGLAAPFITIIYIISIVVLLFVCVYSIKIGKTVSAIATTGMAILCFLGLCFSWMTIAINEEGISYKYLLGKKQYVAWKDVKEVGIIGENLFSMPGKKNPGGVKHIYFSKKTLCQDERFALALHWPDKDVPYIRYTNNNAAFVAQYKKDFVEYNTRVLV